MTILRIVPIGGGGGGLLKTGQTTSYHAGLELQPLGGAGARNQHIGIGVQI